MIYRNVWTACQYERGKLSSSSAVSNQCLWAKSLYDFSPLFHINQHQQDAKCCTKITQSLSRWFTYHITWPRETTEEGLLKEQSTRRLQNQFQPYTINGTHHLWVGAQWERHVECTTSVSTISNFERSLGIWRTSWNSGESCQPK